MLLQEEVWRGYVIVTDTSTVVMPLSPSEHQYLVRKNKLSVYDDIRYFTIATKNTRAQKATADLLEGFGQKSEKCQHKKFCLLERRKFLDNPHTLREYVCLLH